MPHALNGRNIPLGYIFFCWYAEEAKHFSSMAQVRCPMNLSCMLIDWISALVLGIRSGRTVISSYYNHSPTHTYQGGTSLSVPDEPKTKDSFPPMRTLGYSLGPPACVAMTAAPRYLDANPAVALQMTNHHTLHNVSITFFKSVSKIRFIKYAKLDHMNKQCNNVPWFKKQSNLMWFTKQSSNRIRKAFANSN